MTATEPENPDTGPPGGTDLEMVKLLCDPGLTAEEAARELWRGVTGQHLSNTLPDLTPADMGGHSGRRTA